MVRLVQLNLTENKEGKKNVWDESNLWRKDLLLFWWIGYESASAEEECISNMNLRWPKKKKKKALNPSCGKVDK